MTNAAPPPSSSNIPANRDERDNWTLPSNKRKKSQASYHERMGSCMTAPSSGRTVEPRSGGHGLSLAAGIGVWEEGRDCGRTERSSFVSRNRRRRRSSPARSLARWFVGSFVSKWACTRFYQLCGPTSLTLHSSLRSLGKGHPRQKMPSSLLARPSFSTFHPAYGRPRPLSLLCGPQRRRAVLTNRGWLAVHYYFGIDIP